MDEEGIGRDADGILSFGVSYAVCFSSSLYLWYKILRMRYADLRAAYQTRRRSSGALESCPLNVSAFLSYRSSGEVGVGFQHTYSVDGSGTARDCNLS